MYEWYSFKLNECGNKTTGFWFEYQPVATITHCRSRVEVIIANGYTQKDRFLILRGPPIDNFLLQGPAPALPEQYRKRYAA